MDPRTAAHYEQNAASLSARYESADRSHIWHLLRRHLPEPGVAVLEIGCGSGCDSAFLLENGCDVTAVDASQAMLAEAARLHPSSPAGSTVKPSPLPPTPRCSRAPLAPWSASPR